VQRVHVPDLGGQTAVSGNEGVPVVSSAPSTPVSGHLSIRDWCQSQDIVEVIGRYVNVDRRGVGSCPFKEHHARGDVRPSFQVFGGHDPHWYCYTWRRAGDLFTFLCEYHGLTPKEGYQRLLQGTLIL
jgi:hypothetical protein